jgi:hypothetical protein
MMKSVIEVNDQGEIMEYYTMSDEEINEALGEGRNIISEPWQEPFFEPKYDFELNAWVEGLTPEEVEQIRDELNEPKPPTEIEKLRLEVAESNTELFEMMLMMNGGIK